MNKFMPFKNDSQSVSIGNSNGLTFENGTEEISIYGDITISKKTDPETLDKLIDLLTDIKSSLEITNNKKPKNI
jgi:hypothetical protein